jgi:hypothetical protein
MVFGCYFFQALVVVALAAMGLVKLTRPSSGHSRRVIVVLLVVAGVVYGFTAYCLDRAAEKRDEKRIESLFNAIAANAQNRPPMPGGRVSSAPSSQSDVQVRIEFPRDGASVGQRPNIKGSISNRDATVWLIVHPLETGAYWVQPAISVRGGTWQAIPYIGRLGNLDLGKKFELMAIANAREEISEGQIYSYWPAATSESQVITVVRSTE